LFTMKNEKDETIINGMNNSYPLVISAMRKIAVSGQYITPLNTPAIPARLKFPSGILNQPKELTNFEKKNPRYAPVKSEGAKLPPLPPELMVMAAARGFSSTIMPVKMINDALSLKSEKNLVLSSITVDVPFATSLTLS